MAYRFRGRFHGTIFRMDARQRMNRKENRLRSERGRSQLAIAHRRIRELETEIERLEGGSQLALPPPQGG